MGIADFSQDTTTFVVANHREMLVLGSSFVVILLCVGRYILTSIRSPLNTIPGPLIARFTNVRLKWAVITGRRMYYVHALHQQYGQYVRIAPDEVSTCSPTAFTQIHKIGSGFTKSRWYADLVGFERPTLFTMVDSKAHGVRRKLLARAFSKTYLRQHWEGVVRGKASLAVDKMRAESGKEGSTDMLKWWTLMATDVATHLMFGDSFHMIEEGKKTEYIQKLELALQGSGIGAELPLVRAIGKRLPFQPFISLFQANTFITSKAEVAVANAKAGGERSLFAHIISEAEKGEQLDDLDVKLEASALIVAGSDTTAVTLAYLIWVVLSRSDLRAQLQQELSKLPDEYGDRELEELPLLNAVIEETLRLYGAAPGGIPRAVPEGGAHLDGYFIPQGTTVTTQAYTLHRDPDLFRTPLHFEHSRWLQPSNGSSVGGSLKPEVARAVYSPFGAGARSCLGLHLARMELRLGAAAFLLSCENARPHSSATEESMEMENFFLIAPKSHRCDIVC